MASTDSVSAASSASATASPSAPASGHAPGSGGAPKKNFKTRKQKDAEPRRRPSHKELSKSLEKVLSNDSEIMAVAIKTSSIVGGTNAATIVSKMMEDLPQSYVWKPTVPPLSGRVDSKTK